MFKSICKRCVSMLLVTLMVLSLLPSDIFSIEVLAASSLNGLTVNGVSAEYNGGTWTANGNSVNGSVTGSSGCGNSAGNGALTLTNKKADGALLAFDYSLTLNGGSVTIDGTSVTANGHFEKQLELDDVISINITTQKGSYTTSIVISNLSLVVEKEVTTTFIPAENGSYTVDGIAVSEESMQTKLSTTAYNLTATPANGYKFLAWYSPSENSYLGSSADASLFFENDMSVTAKFVPSSAPVFETAGFRFADLNEAVTYAQNKNAKKITLVSDGTLPAGEYTIPSGISLLIPFDDAGTMYTTSPASVTSYSRPSAYRTLTMADGAIITVNGSVSVSAKHYAAGGGANGGGSPTGKVGFINMNVGSAITINNGGALYAWGFVTGSGSITANSGAKVYENFQISDFRGGSATSGLASGPIFPFSQYYVQNIEVPLTIESGATEMVYSSLYAGGMSASTSVEFIGNNGMFKLVSGSTLTKRYDGSADRLVFDLNGDYNGSVVKTEI